MRIIEGVTMLSLRAILVSLVYTPSIALLMQLVGAGEKISISSLFLVLLLVSGLFSAIEISSKDTVENRLFSIYLAVLPLLLRPNSILMAFVLRGLAGAMIFAVPLFFIGYGLKIILIMVAFIIAISIFEGIYLIKLAMKFKQGEIFENDK